MMKDMLSKDVFSGRGNPADLGINFFKELKGGHGQHGLVGSTGEALDFFFLNVYVYPLEP
jgi:hypothetical protein